MPEFTSLEPISTGDVIDRAVRIYRRNFVGLVTIAAVPSLSYYISSLLFWAGYSRLLMGTVSGSPVETMGMLLVGMAGDFVSGLLILAAIAGMSRCIGDYAMLGEAITLRKCVRVVSRRIGDILLMALLFIVFSIVMYVILVVVFVALIFIVVFAFGIPRSMGMPAWVSTTLGSVAILVAVVLGVIVALIVLSRVIFLPAVLMIEGQSAGQSIGRAFTLGAKNWYRIGAMFLFGYFVKLSVAAAIGIPLTLWLSLNGGFNAEMVTAPGWTAVFGGIDQLSGLLVLPIYLISVTLLYLDNRVRKEGYDLELLTIGLQMAPQPAFYLRNAPQPPAFAQSTLGLGQPYPPAPIATAPGPWNSPGMAPPGVIPGPAPWAGQHEIRHGVPQAMPQRMPTPPVPWNEPGVVPPGMAPNAVPWTGTGFEPTPAPATRDVSQFDAPGGFRETNYETVNTAESQGWPQGLAPGSGLMNANHELGNPGVHLGSPADLGNAGAFGGSPGEPAAGPRTGLGTSGSASYAESPLVPAQHPVQDQRCAKCGSALQPSHRFCQMCGEPAPARSES